VLASKGNRAATLSVRLANRLQQSERLSCNSYVTDVGWVEPAPPKTIPGPIALSGGTNYAISEAPGAATAANGNIGNLNPNGTLPSTIQQMANYLASHSGTANTQALYVVSSGGNDVTFARDR
jgi:hypothetical protein